MNINTRQSEARITDAIYRQQVDKANELCEEFAQKFWPMIGTANMVAYQAMDEAVDLMRECGMLRQQVKVKALKALAEYERYDRNVQRYFSDEGDSRFTLWADLVAYGAAKLQPDIDKLFFAIKNKIDSYGVKNSLTYAKIQTALALVTLSTLMYDTMAAQFQRQTMIRIAEKFIGGRLTACESLWREVGYITGRQVLADVDLKDDPACILGVQVILARYEKADFLNEAAGEALRLNPEIEKKYVNDK